MCVCVCVCVCACMHACVCVHVRACACICLYVHNYLNYESGNVPIMEVELRCDHLFVALLYVL